MYYVRAYIGLMVYVGGGGFLQATIVIGFLIQVPTE